MTSKAAKVLDKEIPLVDPDTYGRSKGILIQIVKGTATIDGFPIHWNVCAFTQPHKAQGLLTKLMAIKAKRPVINEGDRKARIASLKLYDPGVRIGEKTDPLYYIEPLIMDRVI